MRKLISLLLAAAIPADMGVALAEVQKQHAGKPEQDPRPPRRIETMEKERAATERRNAETILEIFAAIERRDDRRMAELVDPDFETHWPLSLPYGGTSTASQPRRERPTWSETWEPLQPTETERRMDARVVASSPEEVVVLWRQRGVSRAGDRFDDEVLGLYQFLAGRLLRAQMFYFDTTALGAFLAGAMPRGAGARR